MRSENGKAGNRKAGRTAPLLPLFSIDRYIIHKFLVSVKLETKFNMRKSFGNVPLLVPALPCGLAIATFRMPNVHILVYSPNSTI